MKTHRTMSVIITIMYIITVILTLKNIVVLANWLLFNLKYEYGWIIALIISILITTVLVVIHIRNNWRSIIKG